MDQFQTYRRLLFAIAYRMLGSATEAEDIVQDVYVRYHATAPDQIVSTKAFLTTITTRLCLNQLHAASVRRERYLGSWLPEPVLTPRDHDLLVNPAKRIIEYETIAVAFLALLERLTPPERASFLLHEVFDYDYREIAEILDKSEVACRQLVHRAKQHLAHQRPRFQSTPAAHQEILNRFLAAIEGGDLDGLITLLAEDVTFWADGGGKARGAATQPLHGHTAVARFFIHVIQFAPKGYQCDVADVNGQPALVLRTSDGKPFTVILVEVDAGRIHEIRGIANPDKLNHL